MAVKKQPNNVWKTVKVEYGSDEHVEFLCNTYKLSVTEAQGMIADQKAHFSSANIKEVRRAKELLYSIGTKPKITAMVEKPFSA